MNIDKFFKSKFCRKLIDKNCNIFLANMGADHPLDSAIDHESSRVVVYNPSIA